MILTETVLENGKGDVMDWEIVHECDTEDGQPAQWVKKINHPKYGKYA